MHAVKSINPRTGESSGLVASATDPADVATMCAAAAKATVALSSLVPAKRAELLRTMAARLEAERETLVAVADRESALGSARLNGELSRTTGQLELFAQVLADGHCFEAVLDYADATVAPATPDLRRMLISLGAVGVFGASNFPFAFSAAGGDTASALAAGSAVVVKAHGAHPQLDTEVVRIMRSTCEELGLSADTLSIIYGRDAANALVQDPNIRAVGFTGSEHAGRILMDVAAARPTPIPFYAEMGSLNPFVVSAAVAQNKATETAAGIAASVTQGHGQFCTKPGVIFVPAGEHGNTLVEELRSHVAATSAQFMLSVAIRDGFRSNVEKIINTDGVRTLVNGENPAGTGSAANTSLAETTAAQLQADPSILIECFGPAALVVRYSGLEELLNALEAVPASLTLSLHAEASEEQLINSIAELGAEKTGRLIFNGYPTGVAVNWSQHHGGPYPAAASALFTSVGAGAIRRFQRPVAYQGWPDELLPPHLQEANPLGIPRRINGTMMEAQQDLATGSSLG